MSWGKWIVVSFILFAGFIATLVTVCVRQDISLVSTSYYKDELVYQDQMVRIKNVTALTVKPVIRLANNQLVLLFPELPEIEKGALKLFRPSDSSLDKNFQIKPTSDHALYFDVDDLHKGMYRIKFQWTMKGQEYYLEEVIFV
jgi:hypothetical protein